MNKIIISVIVPVYNVEKYLEKCIKSILCQTFTQFELILVNDGSLDKSPSICDDYSKIDSRVKVIHKENKGLGSSRNVGINASKGQYLTFVDSDDYITPDYLETLYSNIISGNYMVSIGNLNMHNGDTNEIKEYIPSIKQGAFNSCDFYEKRLLETHGWIYGIAVCKLYSADLFRDLLFRENFIHEDDYFSNSLYFKKSFNVIVTNKILYTYFKHPGSIITGKKRYENFDRFDMTYDRLLKCLEVRCSKKIIISAWNDVFLSLRGPLLHGIIKKVGKRECIRRLYMLIHKCPYHFISKQKYSLYKELIKIIIGKYS